MINEPKERRKPKPMPMYGSANSWMG
jgi:hypothetical protein